MSKEPKNIIKEAFDNIPLKNILGVTNEAFLEDVLEACYGSTFKHTLSNDIQTKLIRRLAKHTEHQLKVVNEWVGKDKPKGVGNTRTSTNIITNHVGDFIIEEVERGYIIWWDYYQESDGGTLDNEEYVEWVLQSGDTLLNGIDLSDIPVGGVFNTYDDAYGYLVSKFGKLLTL